MGPKEDDDYKFHCEELSKAFKEATPCFQGFANLAQASTDDIKKAEAYLKQRVYFRFELCVDGTQNYAVYILWDKPEIGSKEFRLMHFACSERDRTKNKPLLELPVEKRILCYQHLPKFIKAISEEATIKAGKKEAAYSIHGTKA